MMLNGPAVATGRDPDYECTHQVKVYYNGLNAEWNFPEAFGVFFSS